MKFLLLLCAFISMALAQNPIATYKDEKCIGITEQVTENDKIYYGICCDNGFPNAILGPFEPKMRSNDCKKFRDLEYIRLTADRDVVLENCEKKAYPAASPINRIATYKDEKCIGITDQVTENDKIYYGICCDNGFADATLAPVGLGPFKPEMNSNECKKFRDLEYIRLTADRDVVIENCEKKLYTAKSPK